MKINPFKIEKIRHTLATNRKFDQLVKTYRSTNSYPEIFDLNTSVLWDKLNWKSPLPPEQNPMAYDRVKIVAGLIPIGYQRILNIGFGSGDLENEIFKSQAANYDWEGIDISLKSVKNLQRKYPRRKFMIGDVTKLKTPQNPYDGVIIMEVLEHIRPSKILYVLARIYSQLKNSGWLILSVPLNEGFEEMMAKNYNPNAHVRIYSPGLVQAELEISKFQVQKQINLYAFHKNYYLKKFLLKFFPWLKAPNNLIILATK